MEAECLGRAVGATALALRHDNATTAGRRGYRDPLRPAYRRYRRYCAGKPLLHALQLATISRITGAVVNCRFFVAGTKPPCSA
jgi:hypothetical protein